MSRHTLGEPDLPEAPKTGPVNFDRVDLPEESSSPEEEAVEDADVEDETETEEKEIAEAEESPAPVSDTIKYMDKETDAEDWTEEPIKRGKREEEKAKKPQGTRLTWSPLKTLKNIGWAFLRGDLMNVLPVGKYFLHIIWVFFLFFLSILCSMMIENTMAKVEEGNNRLEELRINHAQVTADMITLRRMSTVEKLLKKDGSNLRTPTEPAKKIKQ